MRRTPARYLRTLLSVAIICLPQAAYAQDFTSGLVGHWTLDETSGTTATDSTGNNNATMQGTLNADSNSVNGTIATALSLDGANQTRIDVNGPEISNLSQLTACLWFNVSTFSNPDNDPYFTLMEKGWRIRIADVATTPELQFYVTTDAVYPNVESTSPILTNRWYHACAVHRGVSTPPELYVDGVNTSTGSFGGSGTQSDDTSRILRIGAPTLNVYYGIFPGAVDDVRVYNRALSAADISALYAYRGVEYTCADPDGVTGQINFNDERKVLQFCNGTAWQAIGPNSSLDSGLIGHWKMDETNGTTAADSSGNSNNGTMAGGLDAGSDSVSGPISTGLSLDGIDDKIDLGDSADLQLGTSPFTLSAWVKAANVAQIGRVLIKRQSVTPYGQVTIGVGTLVPAGFGFNAVASKKMHFTIRADDSHEWAYNTTANIADGDWHHVLMIRPTSGTTATVYIDGILEPLSVVQQRGTGAQVNVSIPGYNYEIGNSSGSANFFEGDIDDVRIYNRALSTSEVTELHSLGASTCTAPSSGLIAHWTLDDTSGTVATDSASTHNGTLLGGMDSASDTVAGRDGTALSFDGVNDYIDIPNNILSNPNAYTISGWINYAGENVNDVTGHEQIIIDLRGQYHTFVSVFEADDPTYPATLRFHTYDGSTAVNLHSPNNSILTGQWIHFTSVYDGTTSTVYLNGSAVASAPSQPPISNAGTSKIGKDYTGTNRLWFNGDIDDVRIYNRALSNAEIVQLYGAAGGTCSSSACSDPIKPAGTILYNGDHHVMQYCNGTDWIAMGPPGNGGAGCTNPTGLAAELRYNASYNSLQYCEGDEWVAVASTPQDPLLNGLIGHWALDETTGTIATDSSANSNNGTYSNGVTPSSHSVTGKHDGAISFENAQGHYVQAPSTANYTSLTDITYTAWVNPSAFDNFMGIIDIGGIGTIYTNFNTNDLRFRADGWDTTGSWHAANALNLNTWHHVAVTYSYSNVNNSPTLYVNGQEVTSSLAVTPSGTFTVPTTSDITIGNADISGFARNFHGSIDDARVYNRILSATEINDLFKTSLPAGLIGHWTLDETSGSVISDKSGNGFDGTWSDGVDNDVTGESIAATVSTGITFDGADDGITVPNNGLTDITSGSDLTITAWVNPDTLGGRIVTQGTAGSSFNYHFHIAGSGKIGFYTEGIGSTGTVATSTWSHVAVTKTGSTVTYYINGAPSGTRTANNSGALGQPFRIGNNGTSYFDGSLDDVRVYNRALTASEIQSLYSAATDPCDGSPSIGTQCLNGTIYAGDIDYGSGDEKIYVANVNQSTGTQWNTVTTNDDITPDAWTDGRANHTNVQVAFSNLPALELCENLNLHGKTDWYLPSQTELDEIYNNRTAINTNATENFTTDSYWSSTESNLNAAWRKRFSDGGSGTVVKTFSYDIRCIRR